MLLLIITLLASSAILFGLTGIIISATERRAKKEILVQNRMITKGEIIDLAIAAEAAEAQEQFDAVVRRLRGVSNSGRLIFWIARDRIADARIHYGRDSQEYKNWVASYKAKYVM
ncbi:MAG: hypothetical protein HYR94_26610 [Chloroflexi bacterium]|nr:hypothetical protein [Chloroflexota bacterium]